MFKQFNVDTTPVNGLTPQQISGGIKEAFRILGLGIQKVLVTFTELANSSKISEVVE